LAITFVLVAKQAEEHYRPSMSHPSLTGRLLGVARFFLALSAVLVSLMVLVGATALLAGWTAAAVRQTFPPPVAGQGEPAQQASVWAGLAIWAHAIRPADRPSHAGLSEFQADWLATGLAAREGAAAAVDDAPLREFADRCHLVAPRPNAQSDTLLAPPVRDLVALGNALYWERFIAAARIEDNTARRSFFTWAGILIGLITTVLVGVRAATFASGTGFWPGTITVLAIAFPAIGTAVAAIAAFYAPADEIARSTQHLAALRRVHVQIATEASTVPCDTRESVLTGVATKLPAWFRLYQEAQAAALAANASAIGQASGAPAR
jgi:hypothetical protein